MTNRLCDTEIWTKDWFLNLSVKQKLLVKYLFDACDCAGFYKISWNLLSLFFRDDPVTIEDFKKIKQVKFIEDDFIFIEDFVFYQYKIKSFNELNPKNNAHLGALKLLKKYNIFCGANEGLNSPLVASQEKDKEKDKEISFLGSSFLFDFLKRSYPRSFKDPQEIEKYASLKQLTSQDYDFTKLINLVLRENPQKDFAPSPMFIFSLLPRAKINKPPEKPPELTEEERKKGALIARGILEKFDPKRRRQQ